MTSRAFLSATAVTSASLATQEDVNVARIKRINNFLPFHLFHSVGMALNARYLRAMESHKPCIMVQARSTRLPKGHGPTPCCIAVAPRFLYP